MIGRINAQLSMRIDRLTCPRVSLDCGLFYDNYLTLLSIAVRSMCISENRNGNSKDYFNRIKENVLIQNEELKLLVLQKGLYKINLVPALADYRTPLDLLKTPYIARLDVDDALLTPLGLQLPVWGDHLSDGPHAL
ncbi:hypothetical protein EVAR_78325_1 [Eumeta japonica]|uniref:Uncharacterized protein n=1 Tax=Eumeta variegata TaxID=151549 RepID=A0A4C1T6R8_EUMVA|nr:hypothetical protein EVAR_78325_1 [Eumeta japonica]